MAMINCPECGKEISDQANTCIHCGYPIGESCNRTEMDNPNPIIITENHKTSAQKKLLVSSILSLVGSIVIGIFGLFVIQNSDSAGKLAGLAVAAFFTIPFIFSLFGFLMKRKAKKVICVISAVLCVVAAVGFLVFIFGLNDNAPLHYYCFLPILLTPAVLFLVSALLSIIGVREYYNNAEKK